MGGESGLLGGYPFNSNALTTNQREAGTRLAAATVGSTAHPMLIKGRPVGIWILAIWAVAHTVPALLVSADASGVKSLLVGVAVVVELAIAGGLLIHWRPARYVLIAQVVLHVFVAALVVWAFVFVAFAWGLHATDAPIVASATAYLLFACWAFMYLFHPEIEEYFTRWVGWQAV